jgi:DNA-binding transcriptional LysR family regulator
MNLRWMMLFATIAEEGSFTRAAARLNIAQPWLSAQIRKLEYELGVQLLIRQSAGVQVTPEGEALLPYAKQLAEAARMFREVARTMGDAQSKAVRIGSHVPMLDVPALRRINQEFSRTYSTFSLGVSNGGTPELLRRLHDAEVDFIVGLSPLPGDEDAVETIELGLVQPYLLAPRARGALDLGDLAGQAIGAPPSDWQPEFLAAVLGPLKAAGATIRTVPEVDRRAMEHFVRAHDMVVLMVDSASDEYAADPQLAVVPLPDIGARNLLARSAKRELGRAAERYWSLAKTRSAEFMQPTP